MIRALITSGGGAKGAFTVGALNELADMGIDQYDIISGTSTGALIAALTVAGKKRRPEHNAEPPSRGFTFWCKRIRNQCTTCRDKSFFVSKQTLATHSYVQVGAKAF